MFCKKFPLFITCISWFVPLDNTSRPFDVAVAWFLLKNLKNAFWSGLFSRFLRKFCFSIAVSLRCCLRKIFFASSFSQHNGWLFLGRPALSDSLCLFLLISINFFTDADAFDLKPFNLMIFVGTDFSAVTCNISVRFVIVVSTSDSGPASALLNVVI